MNQNIDNTYVGVKISLDNQIYKNCSFTNCVIEYSGNGTISLTGCRFDNCQWLFSGPAQNTINFMQMMYHNMGDFGRKMIEATFDNIRNNSTGAIDDRKDPVEFTNNNSKNEMQEG